MGKTKTIRQQKPKGWAILLGLPAFAALCCGLPVILGAVGISALGVFFKGKELWLFGGLLVILGVTIFIKKIFAIESFRSCEYRSSYKSD